jgi:hypothetical protein
MSQKIRVELTPPEAALLLVLIRDLKESGVYWGRRDHFDSRVESVERKLKGELNVD